MTTSAAAEAKSKAREQTDVRLSMGHLADGQVSLHDDLVDSVQTDDGHGPSEHQAPRRVTCPGVRVKAAADITIVVLARAFKETPLPFIIPLSLSLSLSLPVCLSVSL